MSHPLPVRIKHAWAVLTNRIVLPAQTEGLEFMTQFVRTHAVIAALATAGAALVAKSGADASALAQANTDLANADSTVASQLQPVLATINAGLPTPVEVIEPTADTVAGSTDPATDLTAAIVN